MKSEFTGFMIMGQKWDKQMLKKEEEKYKAESDEERQKQPRGKGELRH